MNRIILTALVFLGMAAGASAQGIPKWDLYGGYSEDMTGGEIVGDGQLPTNGVQVELARVVTSYFRVSGQFNAQFADHVVDIGLPPPPGRIHVNSKELLGLFGPEATYRGFKRFDIFSHFLIGLAYGRDNKCCDIIPAIPTTSYTTWAYALGGGRGFEARTPGFRTAARVRLDHHPFPRS